MTDELHRDSILLRQYLTSPKGLDEYKPKLEIEGSDSKLELEAANGDYPAMVELQHRESLASYMIERQNRAGNWQRVFGPLRATSEIEALNYFTTSAYPEGLPTTHKTLRAVRF